MIKNKQNLIWNRHTKWVIFWMLNSLLLKGSSIIWLSKLLSGSNIYFNLGLLIASCTLAFIPDTFMFIQAERAELESTRIYIEKFSISHKDHPQLILDKQFRKKQEPWLASESRKVLRNVQTTIFGNISNIISIFVDAIITSIVVSPCYAAGYIGSFLFYFGSLKLFKNKIKFLSIQDLESDKSLMNILFLGWDNIVIGNKRNFQLWFTRYQNIFNFSKNNTIKYVSFVKMSSNIVTLIGSLPILGVTVWLFIQNPDNIAKVALLVSVLPRQLQTIQYFSTLSTTFAQWSGIKEKLMALISSIEDPFKEYQEPIYKVYWEKMAFYDESNIKLNFNSIEAFLISVVKMKNGRITIRGDNGIGKSVLMCKLREYLIEQDRNAFYFSNNLRLCFKMVTDQMSSGQKLKEEINTILDGIENENFLLFDEWDANLDSENIQSISKKLKEVSKKIVIIEIRHREDENISYLVDKEIKTPACKKNEDKVKIPKVSPILISFSPRVHVNNKCSLTKSL